MLNKTEKEFANKAAKRYTNKLYKDVSISIDFTESDIKAFLAGANWYKQNINKFNEINSLDEWSRYYDKLCNTFKD